MDNRPIALVSGANKGLGKEIVRQLGRRRMRVYLGSRDAVKGRIAAQEFAGQGLDVTPLQLDVTSEASVAAAAANLERVHGRVDVLVNNAGILLRMPSLDTDAANMQATYDTNVFGMVRVIRAMLPLVRAARHPRIVNVASTSASLALTSDPETPFGQSDTILAYASSKAAVTMLTLHYAHAFRRHPDHAHIKINAATPGHIATDLNGHAGTRTVEQGARVVVRLATLSDDGPSGGFYNDDGVVPW